MSIATIIRDTREQRGWSFEDYPVDVCEKTLRTADYTLEPFCDRDEENDTLLPNFGIERKSGQDFLQSITHRRRQFEAEIKRATKWPEPLTVVVEEPYSTFQFNRDFMQYRDVTPSQVTATVETWNDRYNVNIKFFADRPSAEQHCFDTLIDRLRESHD